VFSINIITYFSKALKNIVNTLLEVDTELWLWCIVTLVIFAPIAWVRVVEKFKIGYIYSVIVILVMLIVVAVFCFIRINENNNDPGPEY
jgi:hypothetical protein